jgi:hypothetical protein
MGDSSNFSYPWGAGKIAAAMASARSWVVAFPPRSGVNGAPAKPSTISIACNILLPFGTSPVPLRSGLHPPGQPPSTTREAK